MSDLFASHDVPSQLDAFIRAEPSADMVAAGLAALGYQKGSPGYRAVIAPQTPVDKAFQVYSLVLTTLCNFGHEPFDHDSMWVARDSAWTQAAEWLITNDTSFKSMDKKETRALRKELPEALRMQCSHELPPGSWAKFPRDSMKQTKERGQLTDQLQKLGLNRKIQALALADEQTLNLAQPPIPLQDYGTLDTLLQVATLMRTKSELDINSTPQPSLF